MNIFGDPVVRLEKRIGIIDAKIEKLNSKPLTRDSFMKIVALRDKKTTLATKLAKKRKENINEHN